MDRGGLKSESSKQRWGSCKLYQLFTAKRSGGNRKLVRPFWWRQQCYCCREVNSKLRVSKVVLWWILSILWKVVPHHVDGMHTSRWSRSMTQLYGILISSRTSIDLTEYSDEVPDSSLGTTSPDHQAVSPKCLTNTTCYLCKKEEHVVLSSCLRWLGGRC